MPCVTMTPSMPTPSDGRCGAAASATVRPLPVPDAAPLGEPHPVSTSAYTRLWKFLLHHWTASQPKSLDNGDTARRRRRMAPSRLSASSEMRQRVDMLQELEAQPQHCPRASQRAMQATCANCHRRFFRAHGADAHLAKTTATKTTTPSADEFCSLDCRSSAHYRATVQHSIDHADAFGDTMDSTFDAATSRL